MVRKAKEMVEAGCVRSGGAGISSTYMQLRSRRIVYVSVDCRSENRSSVGAVSPNLSCCASNEYSARSREDDEFIDLEECRAETSTYGRTRKRKLFENLESMEKYSPAVKESDAKAKESSDCCCSGGSTTTDHPTEAEMEDFFAKAEKQLHEKFKNKYNFDFDKEKPLQGRYEWVKLSE